MNIISDYVNIALSGYAFMIYLIKLIGRIQRVGKVSSNDRLFYTIHDCNGLMLLAIFVNYSSQIANLPYPVTLFIVKICNIIFFISYYMLLAFFVYYAAGYLEKESNIVVKPPGFTVPLAVISAIFWASSVFTGHIIKIDIHSTTPGPLYYAGQISGYVLIAEPFFYIIKYRKHISRKNILALLSFIFFPLVGVLMRSGSVEIEYMPFAILLSVVLIENTIQHEQEMLIQEQEKRIAEAQVKVLLSQIKPHFLYNVLNSIYVLCEKNPLMAQEVIGDFSEYLRANLTYIEQRESIAFKKEMEIVENYLNLEKVRFGKKLNVKYDLQLMGFKIPALSVQILAENAVKHGLMKKEEGGTLVIRSFYSDNKAIVEVIDDGIGMKNVDELDDKNLHVGLKNLRERLETMSGGKLEIDSEEGRGTRAVISIPFMKESVL